MKDHERNEQKFHRFFLITQLPFTKSLTLVVEVSGEKERDREKKKKIITVEFSKRKKKKKKKTVIFSEFLT